MGQKLSVCFGRTLIINDVKNCGNPGKFIERLRETSYVFFKLKRTLF